LTKVNGFIKFWTIFSSVNENFEAFKGFIDKPEQKGTKSALKVKYVYPIIQTLDYELNYNYDCIEQILLFLN
jgi:hypothetical protein